MPKDALEQTSNNKGTSPVDRAFSASAVLPAPLQYRAMQRQQISELAHQSKEFKSIVSLSPEVREELNWWIQNLDLSNGKNLVKQHPQLIISSDTSTQG